MRILLINPRFPNSLWSLNGAADLIGATIGQAPLGLITVAALTPTGHDVRLVDENVEPIDFDAEVDLVGLGPFNVQFGRAKEIASRFRARGIPVAVGGPYVSIDPESAHGHFDHVLTGEAELTWPQFVNDLEAGRARETYVQEGNIDMTASPVPRYDLLKLDSYLHTHIQTSRGCPFTCEFCDIIITDGRVSRLKTIPQVISEIETIHALGGDYIAFSDANLIGNLRRAEELLTAIAAWNRERGYPMRFGGELTINIADKPELLRLLREANFQSIFIGIESPRADSLLETKKIINMQGTMIEKIRRVQRQNIVIYAGMIVGFDSDDTAIFKEQFDFLTEAGIFFTSCGVLTALKKTPLYTRLQEEGRLREHDQQNTMGHGAADLNFEPLRMTREQLLSGYNWLIRALYKHDNYSARLIDALRHQSPMQPVGQAPWKTLRWKHLKIAIRAVAYYLFRGGPAKRRFFLQTFGEAFRAGLGRKSVQLLTHLVGHKHFHEFVKETHGDPETVTNDGPAFVAKPERAWPTPVPAPPEGAYGVVRSIGQVRS